MPELPETETIARDLDGALRGAVVRSARVPRPDVLRAASPPAAVAALADRTIRRAWRRAKAVILDLDGGRHLVVVPRFTGALLLDDPGAAGDPAYDCVVLDLADGRTLRYRDVRRLGTVTLLDHDGLDAWQRMLGPEPLDPALDDARFSGILRGSRRAVKTVLMDQRRVAGIGNIYATEALWIAGVRPSRRASSLTRAEGARVLAALRDILPRAIAARGTTFRDYQDARGGRGAFAAQLQAYGRGGEPCPRCHGPLAQDMRLEGRRTVWCRTCQR